MIEHLLGGSGVVWDGDLFLPLHTNRLTELRFLLVNLRVVLSKELIGKLVGSELELLLGASLGPQAGVKM